jgi:hypothetical protein
MARADFTGSEKKPGNKILTTNGIASCNINTKINKT